MSKVVNYPECAFCNADNTGNITVFCQPKFIISKAGKACALWSCPNSCKDENGNFNRQPQSFIQNQDIDILVEQNILPPDAIAAKSAPRPAGAGTLGKRASPWTGPPSNVDVAHSDMKIRSEDLIAGQPERRESLIGFINATTSIDALLAISDLVNKRIGAIAAQHQK